MKKSYVKPELYFENFQLSTSIAAGCAKPLNHTIAGCQPIPGMNLFLLEHNCITVPDDSGDCYHVPTDSIRVFTS